MKKGMRSWDTALAVLRDELDSNLEEGTQPDLPLGNLEHTPPNPKQLYGDLKVPMHLVPPSAEIAIAKGLGEGADKYGPWNWRDDPVEMMTYVGAIRRHMAAFVEGEWADPDSAIGKSHLDGAIASLAILIDSITAGTAIDNRPAHKNPGVHKELRRGSRYYKEDSDG